MRKKYRARKRLGYTASHVFALCVGHDFLNNSFGQDEAAIERMREAWPILREAAFELQRKRCGADSLPWAYWQFECPLPEYRGEGRPHNEAVVVEKLRQAGILPDIGCNGDKTSGIAQTVSATLEENDAEADDEEPAEDFTTVPAPAAELPAEDTGDIDNPPRPNGV